MSKYTNNDFNEEISDVAGGLLIRKNDAFVGIAPDLWRLRDTNNDGINDILAQTGNTTITFGSAGTYTIRINGTFPRIYFNNSGDKRKMLDIVQWGTNPWTSMSGAFYGCQNMVSTTTDIPILSGVTDMSFMFRNTLFNNNLVGTWNVSNLTHVP